MQTVMHRAAHAAAASVALALLLSIGTHAQAQINRRTPIVEAVDKTRHGILTVKVEKRGNWGVKETIGTGVVVDDRGYAITNCHVVNGVDKVQVVLADGRELTASVHTPDCGSDLAILYLGSVKKLQALPIGPASDLMVGETVIAVGNPFGYTNTVSTGIVSALGREVTLPNGTALKGLIQTNASINPGNSGGPLLNINGELIGINVALREGAQGIAFAINADTVSQALSRHLSAGQVAGVRHGLVCGEKVHAEGADRQKVVVEDIAAKSPAAQAGLKRGDVLLKVAGRPLANRFDLERALWETRPGQVVEATLVRAGREEVVKLTLARGEGEPLAAGNNNSKPGASTVQTARDRR